MTELQASAELDVLAIRTQRALLLLGLYERVLTSWIERTERTRARVLAEGLTVAQWDEMAPRQRAKLIVRWEREDERGETQEAL